MDKSLRTLLTRARALYPAQRQLRHKWIRAAQYLDQRGIPQCGYSVSLEPRHYRFEHQLCGSLQVAPSGLLRRVASRLLRSAA